MSLRVGDGWDGFIGYLGSEFGFIEGLVLMDG